MENEYNNDNNFINNEEGLVYNNTLKQISLLSSLKPRKIIPRLFVIRSDKSGYELLPKSAVSKLYPK